ncbi:glycosyltransferase [Streptomyces sp. BHT-5-2]|uniref:glycosyltransferase n=1 Tax=Streptomyces sp. BHT-5-2 TaxID=2866715 RepID=UPI001C8F0434|nr:glycosyltransferase [Streptomyces sp. BHT-5-2]QZL06412.1 glycosyltransferase [Streptomyces sp. BHT-5-2]
MRVLFAVSAWPGHYDPMVPLGRALERSGHCVRVLCDASQAAALARAGLRAVPVLSSMDMLVKARLGNLLSAYEGAWPYASPPLHPDTGEPLADPERFDFPQWWGATEPALTELHRASTDATADFVRDWVPDVVVHDLLSAEGPFAARLTGVPAVMHLWGPVGPADRWGPIGCAPERRSRDFLPRDLSGAFARHGLHGTGGAVGDSARRAVVIDPCPEPLAQAAVPGVLRLPARYAPYNGPGDVNDLPARSARPRICVVWGRSVYRAFGPDSLRVPAVLQAADELGVEVLLLIGRQELAHCGELPPSVIPLVGAPLHRVLDGCAAVVHYSGGGSAMTAVAAGVPQLCLPCGFDQPLIAERLVAAGIAVAVENHAATVDSVRAALETLLSQASYRAAALRLRQRNDALPPPESLVAQLAGLAPDAGHPAPGSPRPTP